MAASRNFQLVDEDQPQTEPVNQQVPRDARLQQATVDMLHIALTALSQRFVSALASMFTLLTVGSAFYLWLMTPDPTHTQIVSLSIYAGFVILINYLNMRRGK